MAFSVFCFLFLFFWSPDIFGVLVRFIDLTLFIIFQSDSDDESFSPSQSTLGGQIHRTGLVRWANVGICTRAKYKICEFFVLRKLARWPLTYMPPLTCFALILIHVSEGLYLACLFMHVPPMYTKLDLGNRPTAVGGKVREVYSGFFYFPTFQEPHLPIHTYKYMHVTPDLGEFFAFFLFSRA